MLNITHHNIHAPRAGHGRLRATGHVARRIIVNSVVGTRRRKLRARVLMPHAATTHALELRVFGDVGDMC